MSATLSLPFDTHAFVKRLQGAGFSEDQAEVITDLQRQANAAALEQAKHDYHLDELATKRDLGEVELKFEARIREAELKLEARIAETKADLTRWIIGAGVLQTSLIIGALMKAAHFV